MFYSDPRHFSAFFVLKFSNNKIATSISVFIYALRMCAFVMAEIALNGGKR